MKHTIGLMSGTSMDGIDAALISTDGQQAIHEITHLSMQYPKPFHILLKACEYSAQRHQGDLALMEQQFSHDLNTYLLEALKLNPTDISELLQNQPVQLNDIIRQSTQYHADVVNSLLEKSPNYLSKIDVIGYHGQTLYHNPAAKRTLQIGDGQLLANLTNINAVNQFRLADVNAGGQGAPLAPMYHRALALRDQHIPLAIVNCGGIANVTFILGEAENDLIGFDTGPGNVLLDQYRLKRQMKWAGIIKH